MAETEFHDKIWLEVFYINPHKVCEFNIKTAKCINPKVTHVQIMNVHPKRSRRSEMRGNACCIKMFFEGKIHYFDFQSNVSSFCMTLELILLVRATSFCLIIF